MTGVDVLAYGALSALGSGRGAIAAGDVGETAPRALAHDTALATAGLRKPYVARVVLADGQLDRGRALLHAAARQLREPLARLVLTPHARTALIVGTSSGGMDSFGRIVADDAAASPDRVRASPYFGPLVGLGDALGVQPTHVLQVLAACASSTIALGLAMRWLENDHADLVIAGGYDALTPFVAAGFEALGATSEAPRPFRRDRDGLALGEGAALCVLARSGEHAGALTRLVGFAASADAHHATAPDPDGQGLARAAFEALRDAAVEPAAVELVSAHATSTVHNDAAEARALGQLFASDPAPVLHAFKASIGHTLGAAGALELLSAADAMQRSVLPASVGEGAVEPALRGRILSRAERGESAHCLKLSAAFGGANAALVFGAGTGRARNRRPVHLSARGPLLRDAGATVGRIDRTSALAIAAAAPLEQHLRALDRDRVGVVIGTAVATAEINDEFERRRVARRAEPRRFPPTSPNLCAGQIGMRFGLRGPALSVGAGLGAALEALVVGHDLVEAGDADAMLVVAVEDVGAFVQRHWPRAGWERLEGGACALLLTSGRGRALARAAIVSAWQQAARSESLAGPAGLCAVLDAAAGECPRAID